jgi:hypothetical protein
MLLLIDIFSINKGRGYENPSLEIIVTERCLTGGCPLEEACEHCYLNQSVLSVAISYIISVYCEGSASTVERYDKMHISYIYMVQRREGLLLLLEFVVVVVGEGDSCVKKEESA